MSNQERDTHFAYAAHLLHTALQAHLNRVLSNRIIPPAEIEQEIAKAVAEREGLIARFLYDFAGHVAESLDPLHGGIDSAYVAWLTKTVESIPDIPDQCTSGKGDAP